MDHLPHLSKPICPVPTVSFIEVPGLVYTGPIWTFKDRVHREQPNHSTSSNAQYSCFTQQWLYFGLLTEFFGLWDLTVPQSDFVTEAGGGKSITNRLLADYMVACTAIEFNQDQSLLRDKRPTNMTSTYTLAQKKEATKRMERGLELFKYVHARLASDVIQEAVDPGIWDSIVLLSASLVRFWQILYGSMRPETVTFLTPDFSMFHFRSFPDMRSSEQFCKHEQRVLLDLVDNRPNDIAFFSLLSPYESSKSHEKCSSNGCEAYQIDSGQPYVTTHTTDCDGTCNFVGLEPEFWMSKLKAREEEEQQQKKSFAQTLYNALPESFSKQAVAVTFEDHKLITHDIPLMKTKTAGWFSRHVENWTMVAFSHVWADGLGNPGSNSLPTCQLERLQELANSAYGKTKGNIPFWFDTLLIPVKQNDLKEEEAERQKEAKTQALRDMEWVYKYASKVLVLDKRLFEVDENNMLPEEIGARIMCSTWSRRLWTLQEGSSKSKTMFRFRHKWVQWPELHEQILERGGLSNWRKTGSKLPKGHHLGKVQAISMIVNKKGGPAAFLGGTAGNATVSPMAEAKQGADKRLYKITSQNWHSIYRFLEELTIDWSGGARAAALPRCIRGMYYRNCSVKEDEALVLASMISETPGLAAQLTRECGQNKDERYRTLLKSLKEVPEDLLFLDQRRYAEKGQRWIPRSLLSVSAASYRPPNRSEALPSRHSLTPKYLRRRIADLCTRTEEGIEVGLRGLKLMPCPQALKAPFKFLWEGAGFEVTLKIPGEGISVFELPENQYALIFERAASFTADWLSAHAAIISVTEWLKEDWHWTAGGTGEFIALATVTRLEPGAFERNDLPLVSVEEPTTKTFKKVRPLENTGRQGSLQKWVVG